MSVIGQQPSHSTLAPTSLPQFVAYFLKLGTLGFGGPIALAGHMQKDLVDERHWVSKQDYLEGLAFSQLSPGPLAAQLAMYLGWLRAGVIGATAVGISFILPSFLMVLALAALYVHFGSLPWIQGMFYGIGAAVIAIIVRSAIKLVRTTVGKDWLFWTIFAVLAITTAWTKSEIVWLFVLCGFIAMAVKAPPAFERSTLLIFVGSLNPLMTGIHGVAAGATVAALFLFFLKVGAFVFGSGLAIVPFLYGGVVAKFHWLTEHQFVDAVAMIIPGPVVITAGFIGYLVAGPDWYRRGGMCGLCATLFHRSLRSAVLPSLRAEPPGQGVCPRSYNACCGCDRGRGLHPCSAISDRCPNHDHWHCHPSYPDVHQEGSRTDRHCCSRGSWSSTPRKSWMKCLFGERALVGACFFLVGGLCLSLRPLRAQEQTIPQTKGRQAGAQEALRTAKASRVEHSPKLDGTLDDPLWQQATPISNFRQREPFEGQVPTEKTEVRILYDKHQVYFGVTCFDSKARGIIATELRRDVSQELDDYFEIVIDSAHDRRNAYVFQINPLGTQRDALITEEQRTDSGTGDGDPGWDGVWTSEARIAKEGWTATISIPFSTLNFMRSRDVVWGINFKRFIRRKNEEDLWSGWRRVYGAAKISQAGELHGVSEIASGRLFIVKPYGLTGFSHFPSSAAGTGLTPGTSGLYTGGLDVKLGLRSNLVANFTANTDFADADVDTQKFNLTPYKLFFPEKRQFFLENAGVFDFSIGGDSDLLFFSRQIGIDPITGEEVPVNGGARMTGALGRFELGVMDVDTRSSGPNPYANYAVARVKRSLWGGSYVGVMGIDKRSGNPFDSFNQTTGADTRLVFFRNLVVHGFAAQTRSPLFSSGQTDLGAGLNFQTEWLEMIAGHRKIGPNFSPEVGFIERADCICDYLDVNLKPRPKLHGVRELNFEGFIFHAPDTHHVLQTQEWQNTFRIEFNNGSYSDDDIVDVLTQRLVEPFNIYKNIFLPVGEYHWTRHQLTYGSPQDRRLMVSFLERFGTYYDGHLNEARVRATYRASERLSFSFAEQWNRFRLQVVTDASGTVLPPAAGDFSVVFGSFQTNYSFSRFLTISTLVQMDTANTQAASANIRLRWNYRPDSDLYVIYTAGQRFTSLVATNPPQFYENRFAIKFTYSWRP